MSLKNTIKDFGIYLGDQESRLDNDYKHVSDEIKLHWGEVEFYDYIANLTIIEKGHDRKGFPHEVMTEIFILENIHDRLYPAINPKLKSIYRH